MEILIRCQILWHVIWVCTVCQVHFLSDKLKFLAGQNKILQDRRLVSYQITISFCQKSQDICQTNWTFLQDRMKNLLVLSDSPAVSQRLHIKIFFLIFPENRIWHFMQIVSTGDNSSDNILKHFFLFFPRKQDLVFHTNCLQWIFRVF